MPVIALIGKLIDIVRSVARSTASGRPVRQLVPVRIRPDDRRRR